MDDFIQLVFALFGIGVVAWNDGAAVRWDDGAFILWE